MDQGLLASFATIERTHWWFTARREILQSVTERYVRDGGRILDVGCGTGYFIESLRDRYEVHGVDPSPIAVRLCRERGLDQVRLGSAYQLERCDDRGFDAVYFLDVIEHLDDDVLALREAIRVLEPGGVVVVTVPAFMFLWSDHDVVNEHRRRYRRSQLEKVLRSVGLTVERLTYFNFYLFSLATMERVTSRVTRRRSSKELTMPPALINRLMGETFRLERERVADAKALPFPFGLSLLAVGRKAAS
ncbi:MAG TPA: class I SAM-dependent methyltransferase [Gemmatimonadales bacterium]|nr:class I SAM-dependent methyltransferase [Gemmatimonadales bacterium]